MSAITVITPTPDREAAKRNLHAHGLAIVPNALSAHEVEEVRGRLFNAIDTSEADNVPTRGYPFDPDQHNQRVFHLFNLDPIFVDLIRRPAALDFVQALLGNNFLISNFSANITTQGNQPMQLHADQGYVLPPWPSAPLACNVAWLLDDFTDENGGTCYVPDSHLRGHGPALDQTYATKAITAPAGSMMIMDGRLWHQTGANCAAGLQRAALFGYYVLRWLRPQVNWNAALWPETIAALDPEFLHLLGYYSGNVEFQIPYGDRASVRPPADLQRGRATAFALAPDDGR